MNLGDLVSVFGAALGATTTLGIFILSRRESSRAKQTVTNLKQLQLQEAIGSGSIDQLGSLLRDDLGSVAIADYVDDGQVQQRFRDLMEGIVRYLEPPLEADVVEQPPVDEELYAGWSPVVSTVLRPAQEEIMSGEIWNGLARMRREIEIALRDVLREPPGTRRPPTIPSMWRELVHRGIIDESLGNQLGYAVHVANRGIHGDDVTQAEALEALNIADRMLRQVTSVKDGPDEEPS
jgi:hypothetical protein